MQSGRWIRRGSSIFILDFDSRGDTGHPHRGPGVDGQLSATPHRMRRGSRFESEGEVHAPGPRDSGIDLARDRALGLTGAPREVGEAWTALGDRAEREAVEAMSVEPLWQPETLTDLIRTATSAVPRLIDGVGGLAGWLTDVSKGTEPVAAAVARLIRAGIRDENQLTNAAFFMGHTELDRRPLNPANPADKPLIEEWVRIRDTVVRPALKPQRAEPRPAAPRTPPSPTASARCGGAGTSVDAFLSRYREELGRFPASGDELKFLLAKILACNVDADHFVYKGGVLLGLTPQLFERRHGKPLARVPLYRDQRGNIISRSPAHALTREEWTEIDRLHNELVFPLLRFVLPRLLPEPVLPGDAGVGQRIAARAYRYLGVRYKLDVISYNPRRDPPTLDCIDLIRWVLNSLGLPFQFPPPGNGVQRCHNSKDFRHLGKPADVSLQAGDLVLRQDAATKKWSHIAIFVGEGYVIEAPYTGTVVQRNRFDPSKWQLVIRYRGA
jgi:cell wall-associated NlpC family hydrolase